MESNHLTTRTYTAPTCTLIVSSKQTQQVRDREHQPNAVDFVLELEHADRGELDRVTLQGQPQQLDNLHHTVNKYIADLVAKFPLPNENHQSSPTSDRLSEHDRSDPSLNSHPDPRVEDPSPRSEIIRNLPGLRNRSPQSPPADDENQHYNLDDTKPSISKLLLGCWYKANRRRSRPDARIEQNLAADSVANGDRSAHTSASEPPSTTPYLTGSSDRSLDHYLYLGNLATPASKEKLTLSAIQLFDLAAVFDEYAAEHVTTEDRSNVLSRSSIHGRGDRSQGAASADISRSRLPNLPRIPAQTQVGQAYYRAPRSRSASFMSGIPWAVAAAIAVGLPLLLLDPNPNPLKDAASKLKMPDLGKTKESTIAKAPGSSPTKSDPNSTATGLPTPWQTQPVQPPQNNNPIDSTKIQGAQDPSKIGLAPLPDAILGSGQVLPTTGATGGRASSAIAPNPLASTQTSGAGAPTSISPSTSDAKSPRGAASTAKPGSSGLGTTTTKIGQLPLDPSPAGKVSISTQPILGSPSVPPSISNPPTQPVPFDRSGLDEFGRIDPAARSLNPKKTAQPAKPKPVATKPNPKPIEQNETVSTPQASFEPFTPVPKNPNLIDPNQSSPEPTDPQTPAIVPNQPLQSNAGVFGADPTDNPSLQETKRFFQGKWKANNTQSNALQYVLQVSGKSGNVRSITPQGAAATTYLQQTKFIKTGQKLISPAAAGSSDQKIRVLLQPDGTVDTFVEP
jgi:Domain of unknown function (DUF4335)